MAQPIPASTLLHSFRRHLEAENRSERTLASYLQSVRQAEAFLAARGKRLEEASRADLEALLGDLLRRRAPAVAPSFRRRQQVEGEPQPSSRAGSSRQGVEVRAMNTIAAKQLRSETVRCRPPYGGRGGTGSKGATSAHNSSGTRSSTRMVMARDPAIPALRSETPS
jgi:hypothetical protein